MIDHKSRRLTLSQSKYVAIYFYFVATIIIKIVEEITQAAGRFCQFSFSPEYAHIWVRSPLSLSSPIPLPTLTLTQPKVIVISNLALPIGVVALLQFYWRLKSEPEMALAHKSTAKLISLKAVILINFVQELAFEIATGQHAFKGTSTITVRDFSIGILNMLICFEQCIVACLYHWSFSAQEYSALSKITSPSDKPNIFRAAASALNPTDLVMGFVYAIKLLLSGVGPKGNGSWRRDGGYGKVQDQQEMQAPLVQYGGGPGYSNGPAPRYDSSPAPTNRTAYDNTYGYDHTHDGDVEHTAQHVLLPSQTPQGQSWA